MKTARLNPSLLALALVLSWACGAHAQGAGAARVSVAARTVVRGERLTLGDIAEVRAQDAGVAVRLRAVQLGYAPAVGSVRELSKGRILLAVTAAGFAEGAVRLDSPEVVTVGREAQTLAPEVVREAVERAAAAAFNREGIKGRLAQLDAPPTFEVPSGAIELKATFGAARDFLAALPVSLEVRVDGRVVRRLTLSAQLEAYGPVLVAAHNIDEKARVRAEDVRVEERRLERAPTAYVLDAEGLKGRAAARRIGAGEPLTAELLYAETVVRPGDSVRVVGESGGISLSVAGEARGAGRVGDRVQVRNTQSGALLQTIVVDEGLVRVRF